MFTGSKGNQAWIVVVVGYGKRLIIANPDIVPGISMVPWRSLHGSRHHCHAWLPQLTIRFRRHDTTRKIAIYFYLCIFHVYKLRSHVLITLKNHYFADRMSEETAMNAKKALIDLFYFPKKSAKLREALHQVTYTHRYSTPISPYRPSPPLLISAIPALFFSWAQRR